MPNCGCNSTTTQQSSPCGCLENYSGECIQYTGEELVNLTIPQGTDYNDVLERIDSYIDDLKLEIEDFIVILNLGNGAKVFKEKDLQGRNQLRSIVSSIPELLVTEQADEIQLAILNSTGAQKGIIQIASQAEVDAGTDNTKSVTPATLQQNITTVISNPSNLPNSSETQRGISEIATQAEVDSGIDDEKLVTPLKLTTYITSELGNLPTTPDASETAKGIIEIASQAEVSAGTDTTRAVTPATLNQEVNNIVNTTISNPSNLPNATEIQRGIAEIANQAEVNAGVDDEKFITPAKLDSYVATELGGTTVPDASETVKGISEIASQTEVDAGTDDTRMITPLKLKQAFDTYLASINIKPIQNTGTIASVDPGGGTVPSNYTVSGDITSAVLESIAGASARILVTMANPMQNNNYVVKSFHESLGDINEDDNMLVAAFKPVSTTQFRISVSDPIGGAQTVRLHLDIEQR